MIKLSSMHLPSELILFTARYSGLLLLSINIEYTLKLLNCSRFIPTKLLGTWIISP